MSTDYILKFTDPDKAPFTVRAFTSNGPASPVSELPLHPLAVSAETSLVLIGKGVPDYGGDLIQGNILHLTENFANATAPVYPIEGQLWFNNTTDQLWVYDGAAWKKLVVSAGLDTALDLNAQRISNLADPSAPQDAITKAYGDTTYVNAGGDTVTGFLSISLTPTSALHAANKQYVDDEISAVVISGSGGATAYTDAQVATRVAKAGDTMTGDLNISAANLNVLNGNVVITNGSILFLGTSSGIDLGNARISSVADPVNPSDVSTKAYVDDALDESISGGNHDQTTGTLTLSKYNGGTIIVSGQIAPLLHSHSTIDLIHGVTGSVANDAETLAYFTRHVDPIPEQLGFVQAFALVDVLASSFSARNDRVVMVGNSTTTLTLPFKYPVEMNKLQVYKNGIKQYKNDRATASINLSSTSNLSTDTGLTAQLYKLNATIDGVLNTDLEVDLSSETAPIAHYVLVQRISDAFETSPTVSITFSTPLVDGTELSGLVAGTLYEAEFTVDGITRTVSVPGDAITTINDLAAYLASSAARKVEVSGGKLVITGATKGSLSTFTIADVAGPTPAPLFSSLTNFSAIDAPVAGVTKAVVQYHNKKILVMSPTDGNGSEVTLAAPSTGTNLLTSLTGSSVSNETITVDYDYSEPSNPLSYTNTVEFMAVTSGADKYEFIVDAHAPELTAGGIYRYALN